MAQALFHKSTTACDACGLITPIPQVAEGHYFNCPRCHHELVKMPVNAVGNLISTGLAAFILLAMSLAFPFLGFSSFGIGQSITFLDTIVTLLESQSTALGILLSLFLLVLPVSYLIIIQLVAWSIKRNTHLAHIGFLLHSLRTIQPWLMIDVFIIGVLVALVKLYSLADISFGLSFWPFCGFVLLLIRTVSLVNQRWLWQVVTNHSATQKIEYSLAEKELLTGCDACGAVVARSASECQQCGHFVKAPNTASLKTTLALLFAAAIMYIPANIFPIMTTSLLGQAEPSTILGGVFILWGMGSYPVAIIILVASVFVPLAKMLAIAWLCWQSRFPKKKSAHKNLHLYHLTELLGRWSMIDIFVVAILTGMVQLGSIMTIMPASAALSFATVVILTMFAVMSFDSRLLWVNESDSNISKDKGNNFD